MAPPAMSMILAATTRPAHAGSRYNNNATKTRKTGGLLYLLKKFAA